MLLPLAAILQAAIQRAYWDSCRKKSSHHIRAIILWSKILNEPKVTQCKSQSTTTPSNGWIFNWWTLIEASLWKILCHENVYGHQSSLFSSSYKIILFVRHHFHTLKRTRMSFFKGAQAGGRTWDLFGYRLFSLKQRLRPLGYCTPPKKDSNELIDCLFGL